MPRLTAKQLELVRRMKREHGINPETTRSRILLGWPEGRLHEQPITDPKRSAQTRRRTPSQKPKPDHWWRRWRGPEALNRSKKP